MKSTISKSRYVYPMKDENAVELPDDYDQAVSSLFESRRRMNFGD